MAALWCLLFSVKRRTALQKARSSSSILNNGLAARTTVGGGSIDVMDGEQRACNQHVSNRGATGTKNNFIRSNRQLPPALLLVNTATTQREQKSCEWLQIQVMSLESCSEFFCSPPLQPPPPERGNKSRVFTLSRSHGWAGGQTGVTDENMRLSGAPLKEDCWGGPETSMSCLRACVCVHWRTERRRRRQVLLHYRWWDGVSISRSKRWYVSDRASTNTHRRANGHTIYTAVQDNCSDMLLVLLLFNHLSFVSLCSTFVTASHGAQWQIYVRVLIYALKNSVHPQSYCWMTNENES